MIKWNRVIIGFLIVGAMITGSHLAMEYYLTTKILKPMVNAVGAKENAKHITKVLEEELKKIKIEIPENLLPPMILESIPQNPTDSHILKADEKELELLRKLDSSYILELEKDGITSEEVELIKKHIRERLTLLEFQEVKESIQKYIARKNQIQK